ncbi:MAG: TetR/AcrR family transcriptional regulator [Gulosibacter sp.]|uniref:TetR/AcrR family transcriptional regulator n=1 Tax=Gulosibacter sp. TaxID=2817531 RepID=UPI003F8E96B3
MADTGKGKSTRRFDPGRRERLIEAALLVVEDRGMDGLTFRAVAEKANVPLGSTTYHFTDKIELVQEMLRTTRIRSRNYAREALEKAVSEVGLSRGLAQLIENLTVRRHRLLVLEHELYFFSLHKPDLREESLTWSQDFVDLISNYTDATTASALGYLFDGVGMQSALLDLLFFADDIEPQIALILRGSPATEPK